MRVGKALKAIRTELGLTQEEMAAGVISKSFYSKVENGYHHLDSETLFDIMTAHRDKIDATDFFSFFLTYDPQENNIRKLKDLANGGQIAKFDEFVERIKKSGEMTPDLEEKIYWANIFLKGNEYKKVHPIPASLEKKKEGLLKNEDWNYFSYRTLNTLLPILDSELRNTLIKEAIKSFKKRKVYGISTLEEFGAGLLTTSLTVLWRDGKKRNDKLMRMVIKTIVDLPLISRLDGAKNAALYYEAILDDDKELIQAYKTIFKKKGVWNPVDGES